MSAAPPTAGFPTRWLRAFLSASVAATVATVLPFLWAATENPFVLLALPFVAIPYLALFLVLVAPARRGALWMSLAVGFFVIPLGLLLALDEEKIAWPWTAYFAFLLVAHAALVVTAYKTYNAFYPQPRFLLRATRLLLPAGLAYPDLHDALKARGLIIYAGQGPLRERAFRVANMGTLTPADMDRVLAAFREVLAERGMERATV